MRLTAAPGDFSRVDEFFAYPNAAACQEALTELLLVKSKGVALKLYLENFKAFNDMFGYQFGGLFLKEIARYLCGIPGADVYRPVGVEFIIILEGQNRSGAIAVLEDIIDRFNSSWSINNMDCMCSCNLGMAFYPGHASTAAELMDQLGHAADASAEQGPNQYAIFDTELNQKLYRLNAIARMIPSAIESGQLELRYRPSHSVPGNRFTRADSYMRLLSPEFGVIQASEFIPVAEETGLIYMVSQYAVTEACKLIARLNELEVDFESIAVPISPIQFMQERFVGDVASAIETAGIEPGQLALEVPESVALSSFASGREKMAELSDMGVEIVFSDFGGGTGIINILDMPADAVKLNRILMWQADNDPKGGPLVEALVFMAKNLSLKVIAEGVETQNQVDLLHSCGCDYLQGFYYSPTLTPDELVKALTAVAVK